MALPKIEHPTFELTVPSIKKKVKMRLMLVKEEKILLMAKESEEPFEMMRAIKQVVNNCIVDDLNISKLTVFDLEYMFLKLRAASIDNVAKVSYRDTEDNTVYDFEIDLSKVEVKYPESINNNIKINDSVGVIMHWPYATIYEDNDLLNPETNETDFDKLILKCIDSVYEGDKMTPASSVTKEELAEFISQIGVKPYQEIRKYLVNIPTIKHELDYKNSLGNDRKIVLSTLDDFFTFR